MPGEERCKGRESREEGFSFRPRGRWRDTCRVMSELEGEKSISEPEPGLRVGGWGWMFLSTGEDHGLRGPWRRGMLVAGARPHVLSYVKELSGGHWETFERL